MDNEQTGKAREIWKEWKKGMTFKQMSIAMLKKHT